MAHDSSHDHHAGADSKHGHPTWVTYLKVAFILTLITAVEVWVYYIPAFVASRAFVPSLLIMSAIKFATVVLFYMHLRYDHKLFKVLFAGPLLIAALTIMGLMLLFGKFAFNVGAPS
jgi:cytochrome c oxidase subunit 4